MYSFNYAPTPELLHWLAGGQLANRLHRSLRLWVILNKLYGEENWVDQLPEIFTYSQFRDRLFSSRHPKSDQLNAQTTAKCNDLECICHQTGEQIFQQSHTNMSLTEWREGLSSLTGITLKRIQEQLKQPPFTTVHRSIRDDLKQLTSLGWLQTGLKGQYQTLSSTQLPTPSLTSLTSLTQNNFTQLSLSETWDILQALESISFVQPNLELIIRRLWEKISQDGHISWSEQPQKRIFIHLDYILSQEMQDQVDNHQEQLEQLWGKISGGVVQFEYWIAKTASKIPITVYPVCLHYLRRAKYLSAYGIDPNGNLAWHNYRLDRIASDKLQVLAWGDPSIPKELKEMWHTGSLPTPEDIQNELDMAWGFNFYQPRELLIIRFPPEFAQWYVDNTFRHTSFRRVPYAKLPNLITKNIPEPQNQKILNIVQQRNSQDIYYTAWIRTKDINIVMRLRDWRPNGEVIAPLSMREQLKEEAEKELAHYSH